MHFARSFKKGTLALFSILLFSTVSFANTANKPSMVSIKKSSAGYQLFVNDQPFTVKGAGMNWPDGHDLEALKQAGGNSFRTWSTAYAEQELQEAKRLGLMVAMGIDLQKELHHFDYDDEEAVAKQFEQVKAQVLKYKDHPNLLAWVVANEPNLLFDEQGQLADVNPKVYQAISDIIDFIHEVDPNHPVTYSFAGVNPKHIHTALKYTPQVDFISLQVYGDLKTLPLAFSALNIDKPFMVTEFGPMGHWERPATKWGREIEEPSGVKADGLYQRMKQGLENKSGKNIGHFAFEWGQKQERTPTWYGMFNKDGKQTARIDEVTRYWTGKYPEVRAPRAMSITVNDTQAAESLELSQDDVLKVKVKIEEPQGLPLNLKWLFMKEVVTRSQGGAFEQEPETIVAAVKSVEVKTLSGHSLPTREVVGVIKAPEQAGEYRLFLYADNGHEKVANANFPFRIIAN